MFDHHCTACDKRQLIFPSQVTSLVNTDHGIIVAFECWCGAEQTMLTGRRVDHRQDRRRLSARGDLEALPAGPAGSAFCVLAPDWADP